MYSAAAAGSREGAMHLHVVVLGSSGGDISSITAPDMYSVAKGGPYVTQTFLHY
jgi:hypothetical protein